MTQAPLPHARPGFAALKALNQYMRDASRDSSDGADGAPGNASTHAELKSVRQFRQAWSRMRAQDQVTQALRQVPENAGPLNSQRLVLRTLSLMRDLSPAYLQHFVSQMETLVALDGARLRPAGGVAKLVRRGRVKR